jgi:hypothetical protein
LKRFAAHPARHAPGKVFLTANCILTGNELTQIFIIAMCAHAFHGAHFCFHKKMVSPKMVTSLFPRINFPPNEFWLAVTDQ